MRQRFYFSRCPLALAFKFLSAGRTRRQRDQPRPDLARPLIQGFTVDQA
jgi:hypothetical protein